MTRDPEAIGRYRVVKPLGAGAMGAVYLAEDPLLKRRVAVKIVQMAGAADQARARFSREAEISAKLNHPNVITVYDVGEDPQCGPFLAIEFVDGASLAERIQAGGLDDATRLRILLLSMQGIEAAHAAGIVHRDIKPSNVMIGRDGRVKIMDFGIARGEESGMTMTGAVLGTPAYIAPEQLKGLPPSASTDRYAFAVTAFELFTGDRPFQAETASAMLFCIINDPPRIPESMPLPLAQVFARALAKNPNARPPTLRVFLDELIAGAAVDDTMRGRLRAMLDAASPLTAEPVNPAAATVFVTPQPATVHPPAPPSAAQAVAPKLAAGHGAGAFVGIGVVLVVVAGSAAWFVLGRGTSPQPGTVEIARVGEAPATEAPAQPTAPPAPTRAAPTAVPPATAIPEPTSVPIAAATEAPPPPTPPSRSERIDVARVRTSFAAAPTPMPPSLSARDLESLVRRELRRRDLTHVTVRVDDDRRVRLANLNDRSEERAARSAVAAADPELRVVAAEIRPEPQRVEPRAPAPAPAWGVIRSEGAEHSE